MQQSPPAPSVDGDAPPLVRVQDLSQFRLPDHFRGRSALMVLLWWTVRDTLFLWSPQPLYGFRNWLLRLFGAKIGKNVIVRPTARVTYPWKLTIEDNAWVGDFVELYTLGEIYIGESACVSQNAYICTGSHDLRAVGFDIFAKPIRIEAEAWIASDVFVAPGVTVGRGAVVGARSTLLRDAPPYAILAGYPARIVGARDPSAKPGDGAGAA
jgi:putative colanic acid biosynthesis acetyltransferase WcaF